MEEKSLTFGMDWDDTFTAEPELFSEFIRNAEKRGHRVVFITGRRRDYESEMDVRITQIAYGLNQTVIWAEMGSKLFAVEQRGINVDVWIDDDPRKLVHGH